ncbi:MAG TPA: helix-turn-helix domain-containing protein [Solirubrobacterales bacterium]|jgi:AcrR family transcriptional regulator|nr:helix-turn-helix domain-containing protein [Solirubrobacterales bacterium]
MERPSPSRSPLTRPGGHQLRPEVVVHHRRERILTAAVELIAERGYRAVTVADIIKRAGVAKLKFYENFSSKEDCFLAVYDRGLVEATRRVGEACERHPDSFPERVAAGIAALLDYAAAEPALARACIVEAPLLGAAMEGARERALAGFAPLLRGARQEVGEAELPPSVEESVFDGLYWLLYDAILTGTPERLEELRPQLVEFALLPFLGAAAAADASSR